MIYKNALDEYMNDFDRIIVPDIDFSIKGYNILSQSFIKKIYDEVDKIDYFNIEARTERTHLLLGNYIEQEYDKIYSHVTNQFYDKCQSGNIPKDEIEKERKNLDFVKKELRNNCNQSLKKYFSKTKTKILDLYLDFIKNIDKYINLEQYSIYSINNTLSNIKMKKIDFEDLAALLYLKYKMSGASEFKKYRHTVIDEAQDFGEFNFYVLKKIMPNGTFSIFGDLAQAIYSYRSIKNWQEVVETAFDNNCELKYLLKSYRTTAEIMNSANNIINHIGLNSAESVIRHGQFVNFTQVEKNNENHISAKINEYLSKGYSSIALICKDEEEASKLNLKLSSMGLKIRNIASTDIEYNGGICIITSYLSKGLEFDAVIVADASEERYSSKSMVDMKLLYVAMTRPLHELEVVYHDELCKPLQNSLCNITDINNKLS
jgi:DNA helicase-2/ATP-dependent DNA helicase PcrA